MKTGACRQPLLLESAGLDRERASAQARILEGMARTMGHTRSASQLAARSVKEPASSSTSGKSKTKTKKRCAATSLVRCLHRVAGLHPAATGMFRARPPAPRPPDINVGQVWGLMRAERPKSKQQNSTLISGGRVGGRDTVWGETYFSFGGCWRGRHFQ